jgi:hypothetical protein
VRNEVLQKVRGVRDIIHTLKTRKANWICHILHRKCLLKHVIEGTIAGKVKVVGR